MIIYIIFYVQYSIFLNIYQSKSAHDFHPLFDLKMMTFFDKGEIFPELYSLQTIKIEEKI